MSWAFDIRSSGSRMRVLIACVCVSIGGLASPCAAAGTDSLTLKDKGQINKLAELVHKEYLGVLRSIASSSTESEFDAITVEEMLTAICEGEGRIFLGPGATIQDNIDPDLKPGSASLDRKVSEYGNDLFLYFRGEGADPIDMQLLMKAEPTVGQRVYTKLLYEVKFNGHHKDHATPYKPHKRVMQLVAEPKGKGEWRVLIASDDFFDESKGFVEYQVEKDLAAAQSSGAEVTPELAAYRESAASAEAAAAREQAERKKRYDEAITAGKKYQAEGDLETAMTLYDQARRIDPLSIEPLVLVKTVERAKAEALKRDKKRFDELMQRSEELKVMRDYDSSLDCVVEAMKIIPDDPRCTALRDTLQARIVAKKDREAAFAAGNYAGCIKATKELMRDRRTPDDPELLTLLARCHQKLNQNIDALKYADQALAKEPYLAEALLLRAQIRERSDATADLFAAAEDYNKLISHDPWNMTYAQGLAKLTCFRQKNCRKASDMLRDALERDPTNVETLYWLGRVYGFGNIGQLNEYQESLGYLNKAVAIDSTCASCWLERGITLLMLDSVASATKSVQRANRLGLPPNEWTRSRKLAAENIKNAREKRDQKLNALAVRDYASACVLHPDTPSYWMESAMNLMEIPRYEDAIVALDAHIKLTDAAYKGRLKRAICLLRTDRFDEAIQEVERVQRNDIDGTYAAETNFIAGEASFRKGDMAGAEKYLKEAYRRDDKNPKLLSMLAKVSYLSGQYKDAEKFAEQAIKAEEDLKKEKNPDTYFYMGLIRQELKDAKGSIASFEEAKNYGYDRNEVLKQIGRSRMLVEDYKGAILDLHELLLRKDDPQAARWKAECHFKEGEYKEGLGELTRLQDKHPEVGDDPEFLAEIGILFTLNGMNTEANEALDKAYRLDPDYKRTLLGRIANFWKTDRRQEAVTELSGLVKRRIVDEKELKEWPILKEIVGTPMWKNRPQ